MPRRAGLAVLPSGVSILMTSAPKSASWRTAVGPERTRVRSITRNRPSAPRFMLSLLGCRRAAKDAPRRRADQPCQAFSAAPWADGASSVSPRGSSPTAARRARARALAPTGAARRGPGLRWRPARAAHTAQASARWPRPNSCAAGRACAGRAARDRRQRAASAGGRAARRRRLVTSTAALAASIAASVTRQGRMRRGSAATAGAFSVEENRTAAAGGSGTGAGASTSKGFLPSDVGRRLTSIVKDFVGLRIWGTLRPSPGKPAELQWRFASKCSIVLHAEAGFRRTRATPGRSA